MEKEHENENIEENKIEIETERHIDKDKKIQNEEKNIDENTKKSNGNSNKIVEKSEKKNVKLSKIIIIVSLLIIILLFVSTIFAILNINNEKIIKGIYIEKLELSNLNIEEVNNIVSNKITSIEEITLNYGDYSTIVKTEEVGIEIDSKSAIKKASNIGRTKNIIIDNYQILKSNLFNTKLKLDIKINDEKLNQTIKNILAEMPGAVQEYSYEIQDDELVIKNGISGKTINSKILKNEILNNIIEQFNGNIEELDIPVEDGNPVKIDIDKIYSEIYKEAKDAYIVEEPFELHKEEEGIDFEISIEEAKEIIKEDKESYTIPLKITQPSIEVKDLGDKLFKQTLSKYTTIYDAGNTNRASNIALAAKTINGTILLPGETFSYNGTLGNTTKEKGYKQGGAYVGGKVVQAYGGGICQVSTTLYNAVLYANLEIVERHNHTYSVSYVPAGRDATVSYGGKDFKFKNSRTYPIKIEASAKNGVVNISIAGIKEEKEYDIELTSSVLSTTACKTVYEKTNSLAEGKQKVIQTGHNGQKSVVYKIVKYNGETISKTLLSKDTYEPMNKIVQVGTKKTTNTTVTTNANITTSNNITNATKVENNANT